MECGFDGGTFREQARSYGGWRTALRGGVGRAMLAGNPTRV